MERELATDTDAWALLEPDAILDPNSLDYDSESEMNRWFEEQAREARQVREDAEEAIWYAEQLCGDPVTEDVRTTAIEDLIAAHHDAQNAGDDSDIVFSDFGTLNVLIAALPNPPVIALVAAPFHARAGQQGRRSSRTRRSTRVRRACAPGRSDDPDLPLDRFVRSGGLPDSRESA